MIQLISWHNDFHVVIYCTPVLHQMIEKPSVSAEVETMQAFDWFILPYAVLKQTKK